MPKRKMDYLFGGGGRPKNDTNEVFEPKNHIVRLDQIQNGNLVSRSQAKRLLATVESSTQVVLDFSRVEEIGQAFADQIFRVFVRENPKIKLLTTNTNEAIEKMIAHVKNSSLPY